MTKKSLGQVAYEGWLVGAHPAWAQWSGLEPHMQTHWEAAAQAVARRLYDDCTRAARIGVEAQEQMVPSDMPIDFHSVLLDALTALRKAGNRD